LIRGIVEGVEVKALGIEAVLGESRADGFDHRGWAGGVHLEPAKVGVVREDCVVYPAEAAMRTGVGWSRL
jgi:hypothetical protein